MDDSVTPPSDPPTVRAVELLERDRELRAIDAVVKEGGVLVIEGGAGIGKTSLLNAACDRAATAGNDVLRARGSELEADFAFGVVIQLFERRLADADADEMEAAFAGPAMAARPLLSGQVGDSSARDISFAVLHGLYWLAANLAGRRSLVIAVDDAQWADAPSLRWLAYLASRLEGLRLSLLVAARPGQTASEDEALLSLRALATVVRPRLLSETAVAAIVRDIADANASDQLCAAVWQESGGNPFYLQELLRVDDEPVRTRMHPGHGLSQQVAARIHRLDPRALRFAQALAVLGDGSELRHAASVAGLKMDAAARLAAGLVRLEVLASDDPPRFLHPVLREALESAMHGDERDSAHRAAAHLLHADGSAPGLVAAHLLRVRPARDHWVLVRLREAASAAVASGAPSVGADLLGRALAEPPSPAERPAVLRETAAAELLLGRGSACARLEEALGAVTDRRERAEIGLELAEAYANLYRWGDAVDVYERTLAELGDVDAILAGRLEAEMVVCGLRDMRRAARVLPVLDRLANRSLEGVAAEAYGIACAIVAHMIAGRPADEVGPPLEMALEAAGPRAENWDLRLPGILTLLWAERFEAVEAMLNAMLTEAQRAGSARGLHVTHATFGLLKLLQGALPEADAAARVAFRILQAADFSQGLPLVATVLADVAVEAGELDEAERVLQMVHTTGLPPTLPALRVSVAVARLRLAQNRPADALAELESARTVISGKVWGVDICDSGFLQLRSSCALALLRLGELERARELADAEVADARAFGAPRGLGAALRVAGLAHGGEQGLRLLEESVTVLRESPALLERGHSLAELGAALRRMGRRSAAREPLAEALDLAARCGARPLAGRVRDELKATGARPRSEWRIGVEALTPSELRVARLAAEGRTNREIAQALYVTVKTVESHLARVYGKLGIGGRAELAKGLEGEKFRVPTL